LGRSYGMPVECVWRPDRVQRSTEIDGWRLATVTVCPPGESGAVMRIDVTNLATEDRPLAIGLAVSSTVVHAGHPWVEQIDEPWSDPFPPAKPNTVTADGALRIGVPEDRSATAVQGLVGLDDGWRIGGPVGMLEATAQVTAGATKRLAYGYLIASGRGTPDGGEALARSAFQRVCGSADGVGSVGSADVVDAVIRAATDQWNNSLQALFTPGNDEFSGSLPVLHTDNEALRTLYWWGAMGVLWFRRDNPASVLGRTYDTLMPRHWQTTTFIWDYSLSSQVHALLDPAVMRRQIAHWVGLDIDSHFGTEWLTGSPVGYWYSVNYYAMTRLVNDYLRHSGDLGFLDDRLAAANGEHKSIAAHLQDWSRAWHRLRTATGLADYGGIDNLLECVSTYIHEVASLNGANVWCLRRAADIADYQGRHEDASALRTESDELAKLVAERYIPGKGIFHTAMPDGTLVETRHCYDFATIGTTMPGDLPAAAPDEMVEFFVRELRTPSWMRALSPYDLDAAFSVRSDHQWNGAYPAWPADSARSAIALGHPEVVADWLDGLARSTRQGPPGQAHSVEAASETIDGGARRAPPQYPYLIDWACSSAGAWCELVISGIFGLEIGLDGSVTADGVLPYFDPAARLEQLVVQGKTYTVTGDGVRNSEPTASSARSECGDEQLNTLETAR
ncbi:MAG: hypothetical protein ACR2P2_14410, partial [Nakamurella sp.]